MSNKLILRLSNEIGNQMFMYASAYSISKKLDRSFHVYSILKKAYPNLTTFLEHKKSPME